MRKEDSTSSGTQSKLIVRSFIGCHVYGSGSWVFAAQSRTDIGLWLSRFAWSQFGCPWSPGELLAIVNGLWNGAVVFTESGELLFAPADVTVRLVSDDAVQS